MDKFKDTTKQLLSESLKKLMLEGTSFDKITIKDITQTAGLIRPTFYNHFHDKYELLEWILQTDVFDPAYALLDMQMIDEGVRMMLRKIEADRAFYSKAVEVGGQNSFEKIMFHCFERSVLRFLERRGPAIFSADFWATPEGLAKYCANIMTYIVCMWLTGQLPVKSDDMFKIYKYIWTYPLSYMFEAQNENGDSEIF